MGPSCDAATPGAGAQCGPGANEDCCEPFWVPGGTFHRSFDGVTYTDDSFPATVSSFWLDRYEVTVGRFRRFVQAFDGGWRPMSGDGKHAHLANGAGITDETGWVPAWTDHLPTTEAGWPPGVDCPFTTWSVAAGDIETTPINCVAWYHAYAFCIWDGGFLPTEAEWNFAAAGGAEQRVYPWSDPADDQTIDASHAVYDADNLAFVGSKSPTGDARWGHADMAGNVEEWTLDTYDNYEMQYVSPMCVDCADVSEPGYKAFRGGSLSAGSIAQHVGWRDGEPAYNNFFTRGIRCARSGP
jgi:formylglycine-generating enzyme required for sulfatase activity